MRSKKNITIFSITLILTILITRIIVYFIVDPNPKILGFELHHFDYGLIILIITSLFLLISTKLKKSHSIFLGLGLGLVIDQFWFIRKQVQSNNNTLYPTSLPYVIILAITIILFLIIISSIKKK